VQISARIASLPLAEPFVIARETTAEAEVVWVEIEHEGKSGYGEAAPIERYDESAESALAYVEEVADSLDDDPFAFEEIEARLPAREFAARSTRRSTTCAESSPGCLCGSSWDSGDLGLRPPGRSGSGPLTRRRKRRGR